MTQFNSPEDKATFWRHTFLWLAAFLATLALGCFIFHAYTGALILTLIAIGCVAMAIHPLALVLFIRASTGG
jgi:FtsH-binding integral membrane protein